MSLENWSKHRRQSEFERRVGYLVRDIKSCERRMAEPVTRKGQPMSEESTYMLYSIAKYLFDLSSKDEERFNKEFSTLYAPTIRLWPDIRMRATMKASNCRTAKCRELTTEELEMARRIARNEIDKLLKERLV